MGEEPERLRAQAREWVEHYQSPGGDPTATPIGPRYGTLAEQAAMAAEVERLAGERDAAIAEANLYDTALAVLEASTEKIGDPFVEEYRWKTGAYHKILGFRPKILAQAAECERLAGRVAALTEALNEMRPYVAWMTFQGDNEDARQAQKALTKIASVLADVGGSE